MTKSHAKRELELAGLFDKDSDYGGMIGEAVMELIEVFVKQGHSGYSAPTVIKLFKKVALHECLTPLTGEDSEWNDISEMQGGKVGYQNNRVSSVFKDEDGKAYYLDAITWRNQKGTTWNGIAEIDGEKGKIRSRQFIKSFPFTPVDFTIDVIEEEIAKDDWKFTVKNPSDLDKVWEVYSTPDLLPTTNKE